MQPAGGVDEHDVALARLARRERVEHDRRRIRAGPRPDDVDAGAGRPDLQLLDRRGAERVGGADQRRLAGVLEQPRQLADGRRLAGAVDADDHDDVRPLAVADRRLGAAQDPPDFLLDERPQRLARGRACARTACTI